MKNAGFIFSFLLLVSFGAYSQSDTAHVRSDLHLANWATVPTTKNAFENCSWIKFSKLLEPWGEMQSAVMNNKRFDSFINVSTAAKLNLHYYGFNYDTAVKNDLKHVVVAATKALSIISFVHHRDYEADEIDGDSPGSTADIDTVHVYAVAESQLEDEQQSLDDALEELKNGQKSFYDKEGYKDWRANTLSIFNEKTTDATHKMVKGPFDSGTSLIKWKREEEWGSLQKGGTQLMCYKNGGCAFFDLSKLTPEDHFIYVLFAAGDGGGPQDDVMGLAKIPVSEVQAINDKFVYYQYDPTVKPLYLDFAVGFRVVDTANK